jgi:hypothetical protein
MRPEAQSSAVLGFDSLPQVGFMAAVTVKNGRGREPVLSAEGQKLKVFIDLALLSDSNRGTSISGGHASWSQRWAVDILVSGQGLLIASRPPVTHKRTMKNTPSFLRTGLQQAAVIIGLGLCHGLAATATFTVTPSAVSCATATIGAYDYWSDSHTDGNGNFSIKVANGQWEVGVDDGGLGTGYVYPSNVSVVIAGASAVTNFTISPMLPDAVEY